MAVLEKYRHVLFYAFMAIALWWTIKKIFSSVENIFAYGFTFTHHNISVNNSSLPDCIMQSVFLRFLRRTFWKFRQKSLPFSFGNSQKAVVWVLKGEVIKNHPLSRLRKEVRTWMSLIVPNGKSAALLIAFARKPLNVKPATPTAT